MDSILTLEEVSKTYENKIAVSQVSFSVPKEGIFGLLGPNGAGKTSLIRMITTITNVDSGRILLNGEPLNSRHPEAIGYMPEERGLYKKMKVGEQLTYLARLKGLSAQQAKDAIYYWLDRFEIKDWYDKKVDELSKGMQQKVQFIATVLHNPKLIILDEPFTGLDPINANLLKDEIENLRVNGASIIFSTHRMEQVEEMCDNIVLINQGRNILEGNVTKIRQEYKQNRFQIDFAQAFQGQVPAGFTLLENKKNAWIVQAQPGSSSNALLSSLLAANAPIAAFNEILPTLNDIFIQAVGENNEVAAA
jgi:ABC-2 type transport system ATP-binding protein